ncbi:hypothetical protein O181_081447 [Austropuccinia psidii MF-1]|uniref:Choline/ethanolaminephosphotransferase n=1 Tax=Austropuccinia psidii MF-1 TaxID=1389203 RepID=A0A9Q3FNM3_9BASI|nr:hypothetical protein [Austropuccinia psidii MF-1]
MKSRNFLNKRLHFIPSFRLINLTKYRYSGQDHSIISRYILTPYWNKLVTFIPISIAPNLITLTGLLFVLLNFILLLIFQSNLSCHNSIKSLDDSSNFQSNQLIKISNFFKLDSIINLNNSHSVCPGSWLYISFTIGLWIYQSLDAIDGKQARRTCTSSPLGELFDHGCDALNTTLGSILAAASLNMGQSWWTVATQTAALANFYLTTWEEYHTGILYLSSFSGPVEGILILIAVFLITAIYGPSFWEQGILSFLKLNTNSWIQALNIKDLSLNKCSLLFAIFSLSSNTLQSYLNVVKARKSQQGPNFKTLLGLVPFISLVTINLLWLWSLPIILHHHLVTFMVYYGLCFSYLVGLLMLSHIVKSPELFPHWNILLLWSLIGLIDSNLNRISFGYFQGPVIQTTNAATVAFIRFSIVIAALVYGYFVIDVIWDICDYCNINCLTIKNHNGAQSFKQSFTQSENEPPSNQSRTNPLDIRKRANI